ncbi:MAG: hypothetical protein KA603_16365, partial [Azonexus sp.]|nr:hypothetical protein [Azonexus sp.]
RPQAAGRDCFPISAVEASDGQAVCPVIGEQTHGCTSSSRPEAGIAEAGIAAVRTSGAFYQT